MYHHKNDVILRKIEKEDLKNLKELLDSTWYGRHTWQFNNMDDQEDWFNSMRKDKSQMMFVAYIESGVLKKPVGLYKLKNIDLINGTADSAHDVFASSQGQGFGYKVLEAGVDMAFEMLDLYRLNTEVLTNNFASRKTAVFAGYTSEGIKKELVYRCGDRLDSEFFGLLQKDWRELDRVKAYEGCCNKSYTPKDGK